MWIVLDLETEGLDPNKCNILEVAAIAVDPVTLEADPNHVFEMLVQNSINGQIDPYVLNMHAENGLWRDLAAIPKHYDNSPRFVDTALSGWLRAFKKEGQTLHLAGNSVHFDFSFLRVHLPQSARLFSHRIVDVSSLREAGRAWGVPAPEGPTAHRAMADARSSLDQLRYYRQYFKKS